MRNKGFRLVSHKEFRRNQTLRTPPRNRPSTHRPNPAGTVRTAVHTNVGTVSAGRRHRAPHGSHG